MELMADVEAILALHVKPIKVQTASRLSIRKTSKYVQSDDDIKALAVLDIGFWKYVSDCHLHVISTRA